MDKIVYFDGLKKRSMKDNKEVLDALQVISDFCNNQYQEDCDAGRCALYKWCKGTQDRLEFPCNWRLD